MVWKTEKGENQSYNEFLQYRFKHILPKPFWYIINNGQLATSQLEFNLPTIKFNKVGLHVRSTVTPMWVDSGKDYFTLKISGAHYYKTCLFLNAWEARFHTHITAEG